MESHLSYLTKLLEHSNMARIEYAEGSVDGPFYSFHTWPPKTNNAQVEESVQSAYDELLEIIDDEGPFDGLLAFSHGGAFLAELLARYARENHTSSIMICSSSLRKSQLYMLSVHQISYMSIRQFCMKSYVKGCRHRRSCLLILKVMRFREMQRLCKRLLLVLRH
jgi:Serine hydrolase (FSH1)